MFRNIELQVEGGTLSGYSCHKDSENWVNWLDGIDASITKEIDKLMFHEIGIIKNINVVEDLQRTGLGTQMLQEVIQGGNYDVILAEVDVMDDKSTASFWENSDFEIIHKNNKGEPLSLPLAILKKPNLPKATLSTLEEIKKAADENKSIFWKNSNYKVIRDWENKHKPTYLVISQCNDCCWGLTHTDGVTCDFEFRDFYVSQN